MPKSPWNHDLVLTPERKLWRAVLEQAYADAEIGPESDCRSNTATRICARRLLRAASPLEAHILHVLCDFAGMPFDRVVLWARKQYPGDPNELADSEQIEVLDFGEEPDELILECELSPQIPQTVV